MRVIQLRQRRLLTACGLAGLGLMMLYLLVSSLRAETGPRHRGGGGAGGAGAGAGAGGAVAQRHISHPGVVPKFLG